MHKVTPVVICLLAFAAGCGAQSRAMRGPEDTQLSVVAKCGDWVSEDGLEGFFQVTQGHKIDGSTVFVQWMLTHAQKAVRVEGIDLFNSNQAAYVVRDVKCRSTSLGTIQVDVVAYNVNEAVGDRTYRFQVSDTGIRELP